MTSPHRQSRSPARWRYLSAHLVLPFTRREFLGWGYLARPFGTFDPREATEKAWRGLPMKTIRGKWHGYLMTLDLADWAQRVTWLLGRYYEMDVQFVMRDLVKPGDTVIDIGANVGMITLLASRLVGPTGRVLSFEPNPSPRQRLQHHLRINGIRNVEVYDVALSDCAGESVLTVRGTHDGIGTLADVPASEQRIETHPVRTARGDDILPSDLPGHIFIKIDIEGFEPYALEGLPDTIDRYRPYILTEFEPEHLAQAGSSAEALFTFMDDHGYVGFEILVARAPIRYRHRLQTIKNRKVCGCNILWAHKSDAGRFGA